MRRIYEIKENVFDLEKLCMVKPCDNSSSLYYYVDGHMCIANFETPEEANKIRNELIYDWKEYHYSKSIINK